MSNSWVKFSEGPWGCRRKHQVVVWQNKIILLGGFDGESSDDLNDVWSWDGNEWDCVCEEASWSGRDGHSAVVQNDSILIFGGTNDPFYCKSDVWRSLDGGATWEMLVQSAAWPARWQHASCLHDGKIYLTGGWGDVYLNDVWCSRDGKNWIQVCASAPWKARMFHAAVSFKGVLYIIGGHDGRSQLSDVWASADEGLSWTQVCHTAQWQGRQGFCAVTMRDEVYVMGGFGGSARFNDLWKSTDCAHWTQVHSCSSWTARQGHAAAALDGSIYVFGGFDKSGYCNDSHVLHLSGSNKTNPPAHQMNLVQDKAGDALENDTNDEFGGMHVDERNNKKVVTVSLLCVMQSIDLLRERRSSYDQIIQSIVTVLGVVTKTINFRPIIEDEPTHLKLTLNLPVKEHQVINQSENKNSSIVPTFREDQTSSTFSDFTTCGVVIDFPSNTADESSPPTDSELDIMQTYKMGRKGSPFRDHFTERPSSLKSFKSKEDFQNMTWQPHMSSPRPKEPSASLTANGRHSPRVGHSTPYLGTSSSSSSSRRSSASLKDSMEKSRKELKTLQTNIRAAAEEDNIELIESLCKTRHELVRGAAADVEQLSEYIAQITRLQRCRQKHMLKAADKMQELALLFIEVGSMDTLEAESSSYNSWEDWEKVLNETSKVMHMLDSSAAEAAVHALAQSVKMTSHIANQVSDWLYFDTNETRERASSLDERMKSRTTSRDDMTSSNEASKAPIVAANTAVSGAIEKSLLSHTYEVLCGDLKYSLEAQDKLRMKAKVEVDRELEQIADCELKAKLSLSKAIETGQGLLRNMINQNSLDLMEISALQEEVNDWLGKVVQLQDADTLNAKIEEMIDRSTLLEDNLVKLEDAKIDIKSAVEKAVLKGNRRKNPLMKKGASNRSNGSSHSAAGSPSETTYMSSLLSSRDSSDAVIQGGGSDAKITVGVAPTEVGALTKQNSGDSITLLREQLLAAEKAANRARRDLRAWYRTNRKFAIEVAPELFHYLPDLRSLGSVLGDGGFAGNAKLSRRLLDEYDDVVPFNSTCVTDAGGVQLQQTGRHMMLKASYEGDEVILKGFVMQNLEQRKGFHSEIGILSKLRSTVVITPGALVEGNAAAADPSLQATIFIQYPYLRGGNLNNWLASTARKPWELQQMARQILYALVYLHDHGVIHRDIKPSNILMHEDGRIVLTDFEMAREVGRSNNSILIDEDDEVEKTKSRSGTRGFMAPEIESGGQAFFTSDMYSFGVVLYLMHFPTHLATLTPGHVRFPAVDGTDVELCALIRKLLVVDPLERPSAPDAVMSPYFRVTFVDRLVEEGEVVEQDRKLEAVRNFISRTKTANRGIFDQLTLNREHVFRDVLHYFMEAPLDNVRKNLKVTFVNEPGIDEGGLLTEMFSMYFEEAFSEETGMFEGSEKRISSSSSSAAADDDALSTVGKTGDGAGDAEKEDKAHGLSEHVNNAVVLPCVTNTSSDHINQYIAFGRSIGKALYEGRRLGGRLCPSVFKYIADSAPSMRDLQMFDPQQAKSLQWILATIGVEEFDLHFEDVGAPELGPVDDQNKAKFVRMKIEHILVKCRKAQLDAIKTGFVEALKAISEEAAPFLSLLSHTDWRVMLCGDFAVSAPQIVAACAFSNFPPKSSTPQWLKEILLAASEDHLRKFLVFVTGSPSLSPVSSSRSKNVSINVRFQNRAGSLPIAHTCFFQLDIPVYKDKETLQAKLLYAIENANTFEIV